MFLAHIADDKRQQTVEEHAVGTAELAQNFAAQFGCRELGRCCGMLHDAGKYSREFQKHILGDSNMVDHSTAGAKEIVDALPTGIGLILAYCIAGHHAGLPDGGSHSDVPEAPTLFARLKRSVPDYSPLHRTTDVASLLPKSVPPIQMMGKAGFTSSFLIRMLFSCLVDADFLDTEGFMTDHAVQRGGGEKIQILSEKLQRHLERFGSPTTPLNAKRSEILNVCLQRPKPQGLVHPDGPDRRAKRFPPLRLRSSMPKRIE